MNFQNVQVGSLLSVDLLVGVVVRVDRKGMVPAALISWEDGLEAWMPLSEMQSFAVISKDFFKKAA